MVLIRSKNTFTFFCLLTILFSQHFLVIIQSHANEEYTYYGVVPSRIWQMEPKDAGNLLKGWQLVDSNRNGKEDDRTIWSTLIFLGYEDGTHLRVINLDNDTTMYETDLAKMQKNLFYLLNGTKFKIVSNHLLYVLFVSGRSYFANTTGPMPACFIPSINGGYTGKEFMIVPSDWILGSRYQIIALESAEVTITGEEGTEKTLKLNPNEQKIPYLNNFKAYSIKSTGYIMIQGGGPGTESESSFYLPSVNGGFVGTTFFSVSHFLSSSTTSWNNDEEYWFRILAYENTKVTIWDAYQQIIASDAVSVLKLNEIEIQGGQDITIKPNAQFVRIDANKPITVGFIHEGSIKQTSSTNASVAYGSGLTFVGIRPNELTQIYLPLPSQVQAYVFADKDAQVQIDGALTTIRGGSYTLATTIQGIHTFLSNKNLVVQIIHWPLEPPTQAISGWGQVIPCIQAVDVTVDVTLTPIGQSLPLTYIIVGVAVAVIAIMILFIIRKSKSKAAS